MHQGASGLEGPRSDVGEHALRRDGVSMTPAAGSPLSDIRVEAERVLQSADAAGVELRAVGGLAVYLRCPSARRPPLQRDYNDIDLVGRAGDAGPIGRLMEKLGYLRDAEFNSLHGHQRLFFWDQPNERQLDVFIESITMCHHLSLSGRLERDVRTLTVADLLLTKLQIVEINEKDLKDLMIMFLEHPVSTDGDAGREEIDGAYIAKRFGSDWGFYYTATLNFDKILTFLPRYEAFTPEHRETIGNRIAELRERIEREPKSRGWKMRARIGTKKKWYRDVGEEYRELHRVGAGEH